jgi:hypothetical protein
MKYQIVIACSIAILGSGAAAAQQSSPSQSADASVTATGCLKSWDGKSNPATATAGSQFVLTNVEPSNTQAPSSDRAADRSQSGKVFVLSAGNSSVNLTPHLNHKVTVTGTKMAGHKGASEAAPGQERADQPKAHAAGAMPAISVTSLTMVSATCP